MKHRLSFITICLSFATVAHAQKLPNVQQKPLWAPGNVKIDGRADEWQGLMQASNSATDIIYAISNDSENLYLVYQIKDPNVVFKLMMKGMSFNIQKNGKMDLTNVVSITYPVFDKGKSIFFNWGVRAGETDSQQRTDSLVNAHNNTFATAAKWIAATGITGVDSLISVYNTDGIKASGRFDANKVFTVELAISLKHLGLTNGKFAYQVMLNGSGANASPVVIRRYGEQTMSPAQLEAADARIRGMYAPTDFWGEYTLAKP